MEFHWVGLSDPEVVPLLEGLAGEYASRYGEVEEMSTVAADDFDPPLGLFVVLVEDGVTVAGGGYRRLSDNVCEVKRMWTRPERRRRGHAATVLAVLKEAARHAGYQLLRLETGPRQPEAVALYDGMGFRRIPTFGRYAGAIAFEIELSDPADPATPTVI